MTSRDPDPHHAPVVPLRLPAAGGPSAGRPVIVSISDLGDRRVSKVRRGDGTAFTVSVPAGAIDQPQAHRGYGAWIHEHDGAHRIPAAALDGLAARVGMHLVPDEPPLPSGT
jgi:hypothetical protein